MRAAIEAGVAIAASLSASARVSAMIGSKFPGDGFFADLVETLTVRNEVAGAIKLGQGIGSRIDDEIYQSIKIQSREASYAPSSTYARVDEVPGH
ncbi:MAG: hypothetical protein Q9212_000797 [Teloschistes hypoglaucus]